MNHQNMGIDSSKYIKIFSKNTAARLKMRQERSGLFDAMNHHRSQEIKGKCFLNPQYLAKFASSVEYQNSELLETVQEIQRQRQWQKEVELFDIFRTNKRDQKAHLLRRTIVLILLRHRNLRRAEWYIKE